MFKVGQVVELKRGFKTPTCKKGVCSGTGRNYAEYNTELTDWGFDIVRRDGVFKVDQMNPEVDYQNMRSFTPLQWAHYHGQKVLAKAIADKYNTKNK